MLQIKILSWFIVTFRLCFCEHYAVTFPVASSSNSIQFYSAPFQESTESVVQENVSLIPNTVYSSIQNFEKAPGRDVFAAASFAPGQSAPALQHSGNTIRY